MRGFQLLRWGATAICIAMVLINIPFALQGHVANVLTAIWCAGFAIACARMAWRTRP